VSAPRIERIAGRVYLVAPDGNRYELSPRDVIRLRAALSGEPEPQFIPAYNALGHE
jgi:hypothetical protein